MRVGYQGDLKTLSERILGAANAIFQGPSGTGKTSLAVACLQERLLDARFESALRLGTARIQNPAGKGEAEVVTRAIEARLLLIDDVGTEAKTANNAVRDVVFERHDAERPTWITTGFSSQQLADFYGDGFLRRILEGAMVVRLVAK
jgi:DNA replication protein DnaC